MNTSLILAFGKKYKPSLQNDHGRRVFSALVFALALSMFAAGRWSSPEPVLLQNALSDMRLELIQQQRMLEELTVTQEVSIDALAVRLAELQAASTRLDALGERLVQLGQLDPEEFDFNQPPPVGGPEVSVAARQVSAGELMTSIERMSRLLHSQFSRLDALQLLLLDRHLEAERTPAGWPVSSGWISSGFGERTDPFTGKPAQHEGLDFAGTKGSNILGVASGVVTWSGHKQGFGKLLEIDHGNGYITRYAHNDELLVRAGQEIDAGQVIAKMGETGRASSPHVHFEVLYQGRPVNPYKFVKQMR